MGYGIRGPALNTQLNLHIQNMFYLNQQRIDLEVKNPIK